MMDEETGTPIQRKTSGYKIAAGMGSGTSFGSSTVDSPLHWDSVGFTRKDSKRRDRAATLERPQFSNQLFSLAPLASATDEEYLAVGGVAGGAGPAAKTAVKRASSSGGWVTPDASLSSSASSSPAAAAVVACQGGYAAAPATSDNGTYRDLSGVLLEAEALSTPTTNGANGATDTDGAGPAVGGAGAGAAENEVPDISMMGSTLLGGANCDLSAGERQEYIDGISVRARFVGSIVVPAANGHAMVLSAITRIRAQHKVDFGKKKKPKRKFTMSTQGLRVYVDTSGVLESDFTLNTISFVGVLPSNTKVFSFITSAHTPAGGLVHTCHVYKTNKKTKLITNTLGVCFTLAVELERARVARGLEEAQKPRARTASSVFDRDARMSQRRSLSSSMPDDFYGIVKAIQARLGASAASTADREFAGHGLAKLVRLYEGRQQGANGSGSSPARTASRSVGSVGRAGSLSSPLARRSASDEKAALEQQFNADTSKAAAASSIGTGTGTGNGDGNGVAAAAPAYTVTSPAPLPAAVPPPPAFSEATAAQGSPSGGQRIVVQSIYASDGAASAARTAARGMPGLPPPPPPPPPPVAAASPARPTFVSPLPAARRVSVTRGPGEVLGLLVKSFKGMRGVWVQQVAPGHRADKTGQIFVGDLLASIDGVSVVDWDYSQVASRLGRPQPTLELGFLTPKQLGLARSNKAAAGAAGGSARPRHSSEADKQPLFSDE